MDNAPISFEYRGKPYKGYFHPVHGAGAFVWQLLVNNYFMGNLRYTDRWVFEGNTMAELGDFFGDYITAWYQ